MSPETRDVPSGLVVGAMVAALAEVIITLLACAKPPEALLYPDTTAAFFCWATAIVFALIVPLTVRVVSVSEFAAV
jgi:hypothetical protein